MFWNKKKPAPTNPEATPLSREQKLYTYYTGKSAAEMDSTRVAGAGEVIVKRDDHYLRSGVDFAGIWLSSSLLFDRTYKQVYTEAAEKLAEREAFLADLLVLDPALARFNSAKPSKKGKKQPFVWDFSGAHLAAETLRADAAEDAARTAVAKFQGPNS